MSRPDGATNLTPDAAHLSRPATSVSSNSVQATPSPPPPPPPPPTDNGYPGHTDPHGDQEGLSDPPGLPQVPLRRRPGGERGGRRRVGPVAGPLRRFESRRHTRAPAASGPPPGQRSPHGPPEGGGRCQGQGQVTGGGQGKFSSG